MTQEWKRWIPLENIPTSMYFVSITEDSNCFKIKYNSENKMVTIHFKDSVLSYRSTDEGKLIKTWSQLNEKYGPEFYAQWSMFKQLNSDYLVWFPEQSCGIYEHYNPEHYIFKGNDIIIDVLSTYSPEITMTYSTK